MGGRSTITAILLHNYDIDHSPRHKCVTDFAETCLIMDVFTWVRESDLLIQSREVRARCCRFMSYCP